MVGLLGEAFIERQCTARCSQRVGQRNGSSFFIISLSAEPHVASNVRYIAFSLSLLLYDNLAAAASGMLDKADLRVNLLADLRSMADHAYLAALGGL